MGKLRQLQHLNEERARIPLENCRSIAAGLRQKEQEHVVRDELRRMRRQFSMFVARLLEFGILYELALTESDCLRQAAEAYSEEVHIWSTREQGSMVISS